MRDPNSGSPPRLVAKRIKPAGNGMDPGIHATLIKAGVITFVRARDEA